MRARRIGFHRGARREQGILVGLLSECCLVQRSLCVFDGGLIVGGLAAGVAHRICFAGL